MSAEAGAGVHGLVDHLFRREAGRMVASLTRAFGPAHLALAEEVVQDALVQALKRWPFHGVPDNPAGWLYRVARNLALDRLRRDTSFRDKEPAVRQAMSPAHIGEARAHFEGEITDDQLRLVFLCCHPALTRDARVALTLKTSAGFSAREIARAFLVTEAAVAQRLVRAQRLIRDREIPFEMPARDELGERLDAVLEVVYLIFNEGYGAHEGDDLVRMDLCREALLLVGELARLPIGDRPEVHALGALLSFQASRLPARIDLDGNLALLAEQDRSRWDRELIRRGFRHLERAAEGVRATRYHLEAGIAAQHALASTAADTDWGVILGLYDQLLELNPSPIVALNRAVALARAQGPDAGLEALDRLDDAKALRGYYLLPATRAELWLQKGEPEVAAEGFRQALECRCSDPERRFLESRLAELAT